MVMNRWQLVLFFLTLFIPECFAKSVIINNEDGVRIDYEIGGESAKMIPRANGEKYAGIVAIPDSVLVEGNSLPVNAIDEKTFDATNGLQGLVLPKGITTLNMTECTGLIWVKSRSERPPKLMVDDLLKYELGNILLIVPKGSKTKYAAEKNWKDFDMIWETPFVEDSITNLKCEVLGCTRGGALRLQAVEDTESNRTELYIPAVIKYRERDCWIVSLTDGLFADNQTIETVLLETNNLVELGSGTFAGCVNLKNVTCYALTPPRASSSTFSEVVPTSVILRSSSEELYQTAEGWKQLLEQITISPIDETYMEDKERVWIVYDTSGNFLGRGRISDVICKNGSYILVSDNDNKGRIVRKYFLQRP